MNTIPLYPEFCNITLDLRPKLHESLRKLPEGISEFSFANLYLFRDKHGYRLSRSRNDLLIILGSDAGADFFMLPFGLPDNDLLEKLFAEQTRMKCVSESQKDILETAGYRLVEDRDNFDYLYRRQDLAELKGRNYHKKRNLVNAFVSNYEYTAKPLLDEDIPYAIQILEEWREAHGERGDFHSAREALELSSELQLCGGIYYVENQPVAYTLGEELANGTSFVIHFEKALHAYKGLYQFINQSFAGILPEQYRTINREQDLGDAGLRQAKHSYKPVGYVKKYLAFG